MCEAAKLAHRGAVEAHAHATGFTHPNFDGGVELLPDAWHRQEDLGRDLAQVFLHGPDTLCEIHHGAGGEWHLHRKHLFRHVAKGQVGDDLVGGRRMQHTVQAFARSAQTPPRQHRRLGPTGGAGGKYHQADVVHALALQVTGDHLRLLRRDTSSHGQDLAEFQDAGAIIVAQTLRVDHDDLAQLGQPLSNLQHLVQLFLILANNEGRLAQPQQVFHFGSGRRRVDTRRYSLHQANAHLGEHPLLPVFAEDRYVLAPLQPRFDEAESEARGLERIAGPGHRFPDAHVLLAQRHLPWSYAAPVKQALRQG